METKKQGYKKLLGYIKHNDLEHETFNKISFSNEEYEVVVSDDVFNKGFYYISIYEKKIKTTIVIAAKTTMDEVLELIDAKVFGVKTIAPTADANPNSTFNWNTLKNPSKLACNQFKGISKAFFIRG